MPKIRFIKPTVEVITKIDAPEIYRRLEAAGRTCYKSENKITCDSAKGFVQRILVSNHESVIEHESISVRIVCDRGVTHELVRHRLMSYSQESTRYVNYGKRGMEFIIPIWCDVIKDGSTMEDVDFDREVPYEQRAWCEAMRCAAKYYNDLIFADRKWTPQEARSVLPNSLKTEIVVTGNLRNWRHLLELRTSQAAHPQMREIADMIKQKFCDSGLQDIFA